jgi:hypothetical protein
VKKIAESHVDHVPASVVEWALVRFADRAGFFIETVELPVELPELENALYGPVCGDEPVVDAVMVQRPGREYLSRMVERPVRKTRTVTVIAGPHGDEPCVLYTIFGGPVSPKELADPTLAEKDRGASEQFWAVHALAKNF